LSLGSQISNVENVEKQKQKGRPGDGQDDENRHRKQRLHAAKVIKRFILHAKKTAFIVEHDFIMATYLADRVIVFEGTPSISTKANSPQSLLGGMNKFLESLEITFRRDPNNFRPRINKMNSVKDTEQKSSGQYFFLED